MGRIEKKETYCRGFSGEGNGPRQNVPDRLLLWSAPKEFRAEDVGSSAREGDEGRAINNRYAAAPQERSE